MLTADSFFSKKKKLKKSSARMRSMIELGIV